MARKPLIGIAMRLELATGRFYLARDYSEALEALGAVPVHLSLIPEAGYVSAALERIDGVLLPGSDSDCDPHMYGEEPLPKLGRVVPEKDRTDSLILLEVEARKLPLFAICYGMQALNVSRGGSLIQDIESQVEGALRHEQGAPRGVASHGLKVDSGSLLSSLGASDSSRVNTHHHQAVKSLGEHLRATAWAHDGVIECIEDSREDRFAIGVQWHPELSWDSDTLSRALFKRFIEECSSIT